MPESTLKKLQILKDAEFHALGDEILPRISSKYYPIVPFGRNQRGDSIIGQPDSYVGNTANTCRIAIQYTVQKKSWWLKAIKDVEVARKACPKAQEIVLVLPRDIDRETPKKGEGLNWYKKAEKTVAPAKLTLIHGRTLEQLLDKNCQDLRLNYLRIPYSRLSWHALMDGCSESSSATLLRLKSLGRYDTNRYVDRNDDDYFFKLWQDSLRNASGRSCSTKNGTLIPLIADSGIGKTSLLARFTERSLSHAPVLFLLARDLSLGSSDSLSKLIIDRLQGSMNASLRTSEESQLVEILQGKIPLTIVLDGLDELANAEDLRKVIDNWIWSRLGKLSVLVISSRPEFWRKCRDTSWSRYILHDDQHPKAAKSLRHEKVLSKLDPMQGIELPGKFNQHELSKAWILGGQNVDDFWKLSREIRNELLHPFTLRSSLDLLAKGTSLDDLTTRTSIMNLWIRGRLIEESNGHTRLTESQFRECLLIIAKISVEKNGSWVCIDNLIDVPRFDKSNPPGPAVEQLILANILETHPEKSDLIRFSFEAVLDFFLAESMISDIDKDPENAAKMIAKIPFSNVITRLERIGDQIATNSIREKFVQYLAEHDAPKAAVVIRSAINTYSTECRDFVVSKIAELLNSEMRSDQALASQLLGRLICEESKNILLGYWTINKPNERIHRIISSAVISHGIDELIPIVFSTWWFTRENFFIDLRPELMATTVEFRESLAKYALRFISANEHSDNYQRALMVLSYLSDERAVEAIKERTQSEFPFYYESLCLLAIGSPMAIEVYSSLIDRFLETKKAGLEKKEEYELWSSVVPNAQIANLVSPEVEEFVCNQLDSDDVERQQIGRFLARWMGTKSLILHMVKRWNKAGYNIGVDLGFGKKLGSENWIELWQQSSDKDIKLVLIHIARDLQNTQIEAILIGCLENIELCGYAVQSLGFMGSQRACPAIRNLLLRDNNVGLAKEWNRHSAFRALATLRDPASVYEMVEYLESDDKSEEYDGALGLASIGTVEAENALLELKNQPDEFYVRGLVHFGTRKCIDRAIEIAKQKDDGQLWLTEHCKYGMWGFHGRTRCQYRKDVDINPLLEYVLGNDPDEKIYDHLTTILNGIDTLPVRKLYMEWYDLRDSDKDITLNSPKNKKLSDIAFRELAERGDDYVLMEYIESQVDRYKDYQISDFLIEELVFFDRKKVRDALRVSLRNKSDKKSRRVILELIGHLGDDSDISFLNKIIETENGIVADVAYEAKLRITDPICLAENW